GILICGSGIGMSIVANKFPSIRAALVTDIDTARLSRLHNDANVLILGGRMLNPAILQEIINVWFSTEFEGGRHQRRLDKIAALEKKLYQR
ncbi:MAG TPA: RpiB/LacA/LacB family sugar-phosphate isomerase, partial [Nitrospiria bacterium]|nr:RpiB/LacA/LacB family sugar-phosphate isomerase [Nitrospiria bacterium]